MISEIKTYCAQLSNEFDKITEERKQVLNKITDYIAKKRNENKPVELVYICTHNSRRSHFGQVWAAVAAEYYHINKVHTFSGGTEATAFHPNAIAALKRIGFRIEAMNSEKNATYQVFYSENKSPVVCFSKTYYHAANPKNDFAAIMTCDDAEENCPFIPGVELRVATTYKDPKAFDNTELQDAKYDERCRQIALETLFVFSQCH